MFAVSVLCVTYDYVRRIHDLCQDTCSNQIAHTERHHCELGAHECL
jgi:hypothetical protein